MDLNKKVSKAGSAIVTVTVFLFATFLHFGNDEINELQPK